MVKQLPNYNLAQAERLVKKFFRQMPKKKNTINARLSESSWQTQRYLLCLLLYSFILYVLCKFDFGELLALPKGEPRGGNCIRNGAYRC